MAERVCKMGPRTIDIDILIVDDLTVETEELVIPHPRMWNGPSFSYTLMDLAPDMITPEGASLARRLESLGAQKEPRLLTGIFKEISGGAEYSNMK